MAEVEYVKNAKVQSVTITLKWREYVICIDIFDG